MKKIAVLTNIIPPYRLPLFNGVGEKVKLDILICTKNEKNRSWDIPRTSNFKVKKLFGISVTLKNNLNDYRFIYLKFSILFYLLFKRPDQLIIGDASFTSYFAALCCKILGVKYIWWNETLPFTPINKGKVDKLRKFSIKNANHHFVSGTLAKEFILNYGVSKNNITVIPDAVDNEMYFNFSQKFQPYKEEIKDSMGILKDDFVLIYVGQFIDRKNINLMLEAYKELYSHDKTIKFIMVGGGELTSNIFSFKEKYNLDGLIIKDFMPSEELARLYVVSDLLLLVSESEPWGMVVNEAMCFGIPVLLSRYVGAGADLVNKNTGEILYDINKEVLSKTILDMKKRTFNEKIILDKVYKWNNKHAIRSFLQELQYGHN
ncbi:glycosyl transferase, group 1 [Neobacillus bataviensis LMG 21833]|uniref:Glycosyl transferase, group 1 n=1 Tax=Neobacillus bataviensis LMG 21833 TaxID=1117379 RepID=K6DZX7_9BACI|nr:glycosyltransferase family 4 protein [Neobacillus bataviensis]EKN66451.1 glycosyl transferase, group 1 [Neobacillus bataviensis LMG 21833]